MGKCSGKTTAFGFVVNVLAGKCPFPCTLDWRILGDV